MTALVQASYGGLRIFIASSSRPVGRSVAVHEPAVGSEFVTQDRGDEFAPIDAELVFCPIGGEAPHLDRYATFLDLKTKGAQVLIHPRWGSLRATVGPATETISGPDLIQLAVKFMPEGAPVSVSAPVGGGAPIAGPEAVSVRAAELAGDFEAAGLETITSEDGEVQTAIGNDAIAAAERWADEATDARTVLLEYASMASAIDSLIEGDALASELEFWPAVRSLLLLRDSLRGAAEAATQLVEQLAEIVVTAPAPLRMICARLYGAGAAETRMEEVARLNDFGARALVPAGTRLKVPAAGMRR